MIWLVLFTVVAIDFAVRIFVFANTDDYNTKASVKHKYFWWKGVIKMNYLKIRGKIREKFGTQEAFAKAMGLSTVSLNKRLSGRLDWKISEIAKACELLEIDQSEIGSYFFDPIVKKS